MKILLAVLYYEPAWGYGGPPKMVHDLARQYVKRGHDVTVCTTDALDRGKRVAALSEISGGVRIVRFRNASNWLAFHLKIFLPIGMKRWLFAHIAEFDVVHLFDARTLQNAWAARAAVKAKVPFVVSVWGSLPRGTGWRAIIKGNYDRKHGAVQLGKAAALLAQNDHESALYREYGGRDDQIQLWPLAVDPDEFGTVPARGAFRARHQIDPADPVVLFVGRIHQLKGLNPLVRAFAEARRHHPRARLVLVGRDDGYLDATLKLAAALGIKEWVHFVGPLYGADVLPALVDCDLFSITPTHFEETSLASLSACAVGRPVLISDRCGIPWLDDYRAGRLVPQSVAAIGQAMTEMLSDRASLDDMGRNARKMMEERFFLPQIVSQAEAIYRSAIGR